MIFLIYFEVSLCQAKPLWYLPLFCSGCCHRPLPSLPHRSPSPRGLHIHLKLWCRLSRGGRTSITSQGGPSEGLNLTADLLWNHLQVRELEKQLGQTRSRSEETDSELSVYPDPRKLSAQEKNLLRIRNLEREKQESWEVSVPSRKSGACGAGRPRPCL